MKVHLGAFASVKKNFYKKTDNFVKRGLIVACVFMNISEIEEFFGSYVINYLRSTYQIDMLKALLLSNPGLLRDLILNIGLVLI